jgi:dihydroneopterin aldolase
MDTIILSGVEFYAYGGVTEAEKRIGQRYRATVELRLDLSRAAQTDAVEDTIHYGEVAETIVATAREAPFNLIESAAARIVDRLLQRFPAQSVTLRLEKLLPPIDGVVASAAVEITRGRE